MYQARIYMHLPESSSLFLMSVRVNVGTSEKGDREGDICLISGKTYISIVQIRKKIKSVIVVPRNSEVVYCKGIVFSNYIK